MKKPPAYYWDSCVFIAYFNDERASYGYLIDHIRQFLEEAQSGACQIYTSAITIAEITEQTLNKGGVGSFNEFLRDFQSSIFIMEADPNTMSIASRLRSQRYILPGGTKPRSLSPPDAIHLATAISLDRTYGITIDRLHTFDAGRTRGLDGGRGVPMLEFEKWTSECRDDELVKQVVRTQRSTPEHPAPKLRLD